MFNSKDTIFAIEMRYRGLSHSCSVFLTPIIVRLFLPASLHNFKIQTSTRNSHRRESSLLEHPSNSANSTARFSALHWFAVADPDGAPSLLLNPALTDSAARRVLREQRTLHACQENIVKAVWTRFNGASADVLVFPSQVCNRHKFEREETSSTCFACSEASLAMGLGPVIVYVRTNSRLPRSLPPVFPLQAWTQARSARRC
ncbi:hypothetical protein AcV7_003272 [Taiwanofungus camphoratus]|nr:hypothetical protein AcV7_003272 [Antrodia cinnamomea]